MSSTLQQVEQATGRDKFAVLAVAIDQVAEHVRAARPECMDEEIATLDVRELAERFDISFERMRDHLREVLGEAAVFRLGKKWVIRKRRFLEYLQRMETRHQSGA